MAATNPDTGSGLQTAGDVVCIYYKNIKDQRDTAESKAQAANTQLDTADIVRGYKLCCLEQTEATHDYYRCVDQFELLDMVKSSEIVKTKIDGYITKNTELQKIIQDASKMLNDIKSRLHDAHNAACAMHNCINRIVDTETPSSNQSIRSLIETLQRVTDKAKTLDTDSKNAAKAMVHIAGIQTFSDVDGLKAFGGRLCDGMKELKTDVDAYVKGAAEESITIAAEVSDVVVKMNNAEFDWFTHDTAVNGFDKILHFICNGECKNIDCVEEICMQMGSESDPMEQSKNAPYAQSNER